MSGYYQQEVQPSAERRAPLSVSAAMGIAKDTLESLQLTVVGEVSEVSSNPRYKAVYFTLHDDGAAMSCLIWRSIYAAIGVELRAGMLVEVTGKFSAYVPKGRMNFQVRTISLAGEGNLRMRVAALAKKLEKEGLMAPSRKRPLPRLPERIAIVTSPRGAAVHDCIKTLRRRYPLAEVVICGVTVEGAKAPADLIHGLEVAEASGADVILLVRGGGSYEDLMPFNDERLARKVASCAIPVVTGIGHQPDNSIADMVSDLRCATPTAAAESVAPAADELMAHVQTAGSRLAGSLGRRLDRTAVMLDHYLGRPLFADPQMLLSVHWQTADLMSDRLCRAIPDSLIHDGQRIASFAERMQRHMPADLTRRGEQLHSLDTRMRRSQGVNHARFDRATVLYASRLSDLSPLNVLKRGYALAYDTETGGVVDSVDKTEEGRGLQVKLSDGDVMCEVRQVNPAETNDNDSPAASLP